MHMVFNAQHSSNTGFSISSLFLGSMFLKLLLDLWACLISFTATCPPQEYLFRPSKKIKKKFSSRIWYINIAMKCCQNTAARKPCRDGLLVQAEGFSRLDAPFQSLLSSTEGDVWFKSGSNIIGLVPVWREVIRLGWSYRNFKCIVRVCSDFLTCFSFLLIHVMDVGAFYMPSWNTPTQAVSTDANDTAVEESTSRHNTGPFSLLLCTTPSWC